jgi:hypothetical protein
MFGRSQLVIDDLSWNLDDGEIILTLTSKIDQTLTVIEREGIKTMTVVGGEAEIVDGLIESSTTTAPQTKMFAVIFLSFYR